MKGKWSVLVLVLAALLLVGSMGPTVVAERLPQGSGDGNEPDTSLSDAAKLESAPDMDGYVGPVYQGIMDLGAEVSSADGLPGELPDWEQFFLEPQPDDTPFAITDDAGVNWTGYYYYRAAGSVLKPRDSSVSWANDGSGGCLYLSSGNTNTIFNIHLDVPHGSRIEYLRIYYYDTSAANSIAWVTRYNDAGGLTDITNVSSASNTGYGTQLGAYLEHIVDTVNYSYVLNWRPYQLGSTMQLCGLRVAYSLP
jgi:hypothetical protein